MARQQLYFLYTTYASEENDYSFIPKESWVVKAQDRSDALVKLLPKLFLGGRTIRSNKHRELFLRDIGSTLERKVFVIPLDIEAHRNKRFAFLAISAHGIDFTRVSNQPEKAEKMVRDQISAQYGSTMLDKFTCRGYRII